MKVTIVMISCVAVGGLGIYYLYLKGTGGITPFKAAVISFLMSFLYCVMLIIMYFYKKENLKNVLVEPLKSEGRRDTRGLIFLISVFGLIFAFSLFFILRNMLKF